MPLMIVESPNKVKKISAILGKGWIVAASVGHIRDLPLKPLGVDSNTFEPQYELTERGASIVARLKPIADKADKIYLATDPDREGEAIAWHLKEALGLSNPLRVTFNAITETAIKTAVAAPRHIDMQLVRAQEARRVFDRLVGYLVSPVLSRSKGVALSAGRVQSPALRLVVERERDIAAFADIKHFGARVEFDGGAWSAEWDVKPHLGAEQKYCLDEALANKAAACRQFLVKSSEQKIDRQAPRAPFTTSALLQAASVAFKWNASKTQDLAQKLFEGGHITYHRTDSPNLSDESIAEIRAFAEGEGYQVADKPRKWPSKEDAQEAHEAIRPTHLEEREAGEADEKKLYALIWKRAVASQLADAQTNVVTLALQSDEFCFTATGRTPLDPGWRALASDEGEDKEPGEGAVESGVVPLLSEGASKRADKGLVLAKKTKPPPRYTEARLIKKLEHLGIGRPSTYAAILSNIIETRAYLERRKNLLAPTNIGETVIDALFGHAGFLDYDFTRRAEADLDRIAEGKADYPAIVAALAAALDKDLAALKSMAPAPLYPCPSCGKALRRLKGTNGPFWGCEGYKDGCKTTMQDENGKPAPRTAPESSKYKCPNCGRPLVRRTKSGAGGYDFWGCSGFKEGCKTSFETKRNAPDFGAAQKKKAAS